MSCTKLTAASAQKKNQRYNDITIEKEKKLPYFKLTISILKKFYRYIVISFPSLISSQQKKLCPRHGYIFYFLAAALIAGCSPTPKQKGSLIADDSSVTKEYRLDDNQFAIIVIQKKGMSKADVKKLAMQRAAQITLEQGSRYFVILKEQDINILEAPNNQKPQSNLYEEKILNKDTRGDGIVTLNPSSGTPQPGLRLTIQIYQENPGNSYDAYDQ